MSRRFTRSWKELPASGRQFSILKADTMLCRQILCWPERSRSCRRREKNTGWRRPWRRSQPTMILSWSTRRLPWACWRWMPLPALRIFWFQRQRGFLRPQEYRNSTRRLPVFRSIATQTWKLGVSCLRNLIRGPISAGRWRSSQNSLASILLHRFTRRISDLP